MAKHDLDVINSQIDLIDLIEKAGGRPRKAGSEWRSNCPLHGGNNPSGLAVYDNGRCWTCFTGECGSGDALRFIMTWRKCGLLDAIEYATGGVPIPPEDVVRIQAEQAARAAADLQRQIERAQAVLDELNQTKIWLQYHEELVKNDTAKRWWEGRGIPYDWQGFWQLGYSPDRRIWVGEELHAQTATIPIWQPGWNCTQVKHRLIGAPDGAGKYRYEYSDLPAPVFVCDPDMVDQTNIVVVEGEIKAMVTFLTLDTPGWQVIGMPGKKASIDHAKRYIQGNEMVYICCDPDTGELNDDMAREIGKDRCLIVETPIKIDDYILAAGIDRQKLLTMFGQSRRIR